MRKLILNRILEFYDVPQLFLAKDTMNGNYICLLYNQTDGYDYIGAQVSDIRMKSFLNGEFDLRNAYTSPEQDNVVYHVSVKDRAILADKLLQSSDITEDMLPSPGYYFEKDDAISQTESDSIQINIPIKDRTFFSDMAKRMGWATTILESASSKIAIL